MLGRTTFGYNYSCKSSQISLFAQLCTAWYFWFLAHTGFTTQMCPNHQIDNPWYKGSLKAFMWNKMFYFSGSIPGRTLLKNQRTHNYPKSFVYTQGNPLCTHICTTLLYMRILKCFFIFQSSFPEGLTCTRLLMILCLFCTIHQLHFADEM